MIFDTDILIWIQKGNRKAANLMDKTAERAISVCTYMELMQGAHNKTHHKYIKELIKKLDIQVIPLTENIGHRASIYVEEYSLSHGIGAIDAIIASTAVENDLILVSSNSKHYKAIKELKFKRFEPL